MRLRTQLILAFLLLAIVPLCGIVLFSYLTSQRALRQAYEAEGRVMAQEVERRMQGVRADLLRRVEHLGRMPVLARALGSDAVDSQALSDLVAAIGDAAPLFQALEFVPTVAETAAASSSPGSGQRGITIHLRALDVEGEEREVWVEEFDGEQRRTSPPLLFGPRSPGGGTLRSALHPSPPHARPALDVADKPRAAGLAPPLPALNDELKEFLEDRVAGAPPLGSEALFETRISELMAGKIEAAVEDGNEVLGTLRAEISLGPLLHRVLASADRETGEIPFALDGEQRLFTPDAADRDRLEQIPMACLAPTDGSEPVTVSDWVVVSDRDPDSGITLGIARPIGGPLREIRAAAMRNLGYGVGMIGLALLGILPLSNRMTRSLSRLGLGVDQIAKGDLQARVKVSGSYEIAQLAKNFNRMAQQLSEHQERLLREERLRKQQEIERELLRHENERRGRELEEARQFQLSMLPKQIPEHRDFEIAVSMHTATEVGGDYYDLIEGEGGAFTLAIGDATGHGAMAGTMVAVIKSLFTSSGSRCEPRDFLEEASSTLRRMRLGRMSMALTIVRCQGSRLRVSSAAMPPALLHRQADDTVEELAFASVPLGSMADVRYRERELQLCAGDTLLFMSDGFAELPNAQGEPLGYDGVRRIFAGCAVEQPDELIACLEAACRDWVAGAQLPDDVTFVVLRRRAAA